MSQFEEEGAKLEQLKVGEIYLGGEARKMDVSTEVLSLPQTNCLSAHACQWIGIRDMAWMSVTSFHHSLNFTLY